MTKNSLLLTCAIGAFAGFALTDAATAAQTAAPQASDGSATEVGAVIVTAEKRSQNLQKVPVAVTAFTTKQRDLVGIENLQDMTNFTPGLVYSSALDRVAIRGIGRQTNLLSSEAAVATYVDGFFTTSAVEAAKPPMFVQSVEVLRGPQGTLQGRNSIGGALLVTTAQPTSTPYAEARLNVGNYGYTDVEAVISGPLADGLDFRLQGYDTQQTQGYFKDLAGGPSEGNVLDEYYVEPSIKAKLGDNADLYMKAFVAGWNNRGGPGARTGYTSGAYSTDSINDYSVPLFFNPAAAFNPTANDIVNVTTLRPGLSQNPALTNVRDFSANAPLSVKLTNSYDFDTEFTYHFPSFDVKYTGGFQQYKYDLGEDNADGATANETDVTSYQIGTLTNPTCAGGAASGCLTVFPTLVGHYEENNQWYSHEITFASTTSSAVQWIGGLYYYDEHYSNPITQQAPDQAQVAAPVGGPANPGNYLYYTNYNMVTRSEAAYGQVDWKVTPTIKLTGGLRYTSDYKSGSEEERVVVFGGSTAAAAGLYQPTVPTSLAQLPLLEATADPVIDGSLTPAIDFTPDIAATCAGLSSGGRGIKSNCLYNSVTGLLSREIGGTSSATTGTAGVEWTPTTDTLAYFRYSRGYKAAAINAGTLAASPEISPEYINDYEVGWKQTFNRNLVVDADVYYYDYENLQTPVTVFNGVENTAILTNIPKSRADGFELETIWTPIDHLQFNLSYSFEDSAILTGCNGGTVGCYVDTNSNNPAAISVKGDPLPNAPRNKVGFNTNYTFVFDPGSLTLSASYIWRDATYGGIFKEAYDEAPSWDQVDLRATWKAPGDRYEIIAYGRNVFNSNGYEAAANGVTSGAAGGPVVAHNVYGLNPPATYGLELHYKFF